ncbi:hypothetical protein PHYSODRAFT_348749 [Phytophthora sojae]|uniref:Uncharacterized protein n=1 Tax=Phytophthora sojae (strain P6497) TaxID=1094619 RepID=G5AJ37_PHYSP|nr:hypothetical protein PHYSODRAFT_348749 [Phytophthora sojae]EGZ04469.1 hypothetical protein PHYSODRAFT_348749 [Phytophthora sojae]|eukprot:XP_009540088.1 hypothetical protein PHYSODRAFT_348749 [Phytophthora sojae]
MQNEHDARTEAALTSRLETLNVQTQEEMRRIHGEVEEMKRVETERQGAIDNVLETLVTQIAALGVQDRQIKSETERPIGNIARAIVDERVAAVEQRVNSSESRSDAKLCAINDAVNAVEARLGIQMQHAVQTESDALKQAIAEDTARRCNEERQATEVAMCNEMSGAAALLEERVLAAVQKKIDEVTAQVAQQHDRRGNWHAEIMTELEELKTRLGRVEKQAEADSEKKCAACEQQLDTYRLSPKLITARADGVPA